ncbi:hypothetical protein MNQ96_09780 [Sphingopyxis granuli]|uniref:hypothetical protein n=1 Tax=Sphingopyxis granuli TaxID=267128 RepID=UPI001F52C257|nr:hypothetical protein [Sphingopyxis granuli]UNK77884.1 hypothetical protein MNQ96_09780 [Sphingopyxis granuli]
MSACALPARRCPPRGNKSAFATFMQRVDDFLRESRMPPSVLGLNAIGDSGALTYWRKGRLPRFRTMRRVDAYMESWRRERGQLDRLTSRYLLPPKPEVVADGPLASSALTAAGNDPRKAIELLRIAIESIQPLAKAA